MDSYHALINCATLSIYAYLVYCVITHTILHDCTLMFSLRNKKTRLIIIVVVGVGFEWLSGLTQSNPISERWYNSLYEF